MTSKILAASGILTGAATAEAGLLSWVSEPTAVALAFAALGLVAFVLRRRRKANAAAVQVD